ncbi:MAG: S-methyl-5-thioribose-1-phosphate isomerase [Chitinispirillia bacterium]|nr:S-methyl-5-thioribose-1-phosphate isomerase [Chitinispirillia bacterium]MCL2269244.1 S-methyl-5-thioribose-1-phosphate isomerase [Chitinispirillia bacterium]
MNSRLKTIEWRNSCARIIDQTLLPEQISYIDVDTLDKMYHAIKILQIRGAPAIGVAAAYGLYLGVRDFNNDADINAFLKHVDDRAEYLASARPTAVNLFWALGRMKKFAHDNSGGGISVNALKKMLFDEANRILDEDRKMCRAIGEYGFELLKDKDCILTHCNAGGLATSEFGTALAPIYVGQEKGVIFKVFADETRPLLQGARITSLELSEAGIPVTVICDNMSASVMATGKIKACIVGADRIAANGDTANKIGTYGVALIAAAHNIPFYVAAPSSTFDLSIPDGTHIPIEERGREEVANWMGTKKTVPDKVMVFNPSFDVTPSKLITAIITEKGAIFPPYVDNIAKLLG